MANALRMSNQAVNAEADALALLAISGTIRLYDGTQPATADTTISGQNLLAEMTFGAPAFGASVSGILTAEAITLDTAAAKDGDATWFRVSQVSTDNPLWDGSVGVSGCDMNLNSITVTSGLPVTISSFIHTIPKV